MVDPIIGVSGAFVAIVESSLITPVVTMIHFGFFLGGNLPVVKIPARQPPQNEVARVFQHERSKFTSRSESVSSVISNNSTTNSPAVTFQPVLTSDTDIGNSSYGHSVVDQVKLHDLACCIFSHIPNCLVFRSMHSRMPVNTAL